TPPLPMALDSRNTGRRGFLSLQGKRKVVQSFLGKFLEGDGALAQRLSKMARHARTSRRQEDGLLSVRFSRGLLLLRRLFRDFPFLEGRFLQDAVFVDGVVGNHAGLL